jgi:hypothetical protein
VSFRPATSRPTPPAPPTRRMRAARGLVLWESIRPDVPQVAQ